MKKENILMLAMVILLVVVISITMYESYSREQSIEKIEQNYHEKERVIVKYIGNGVSIITIDNHEYIHYRDGMNAASVGGFIHKQDCKFCIANDSLKKEVKNDWTNKT